MIFVEFKDDYFYYKDIENRPFTLRHLMYKTQSYICLGFKSNLEPSIYTVK